MADIAIIDELLEELERQLKRKYDHDIDLLFLYAKERADAIEMEIEGLRLVLDSAIDSIKVQQ
jgi:hypothetical protein